MKNKHKSVEELAEKLHEWYLEATKELNPESYNPNAQKSYAELTEEQKQIDRHIAKKITHHTTQIRKEAVEEIRKETENWSLDGYSYVQVPKWVVEQIRKEAMEEESERIIQIIKESGIWVEREGKVSIVGLIDLQTLTNPNNTKEVLQGNKEVR